MYFYCFNEGRFEERQEYVVLHKKKMQQKTVAKLLLKTLKEHTVLLQDFDDCKVLVELLVLAGFVFPNYEVSLSFEDPWRRDLTKELEDVISGNGG